MAKILSAKELIAAINADAKSVALDSDNQLRPEDRVHLVSQFEKGAPTIVVTPNEKGEHQLTIENMDTIDTYRANFHEAYGSITKDLIGEAVRKDPEIGALEVDLEVGKTKFSTAFARPTGDAPSQKDWAASVGFGYSTVSNKALEGKLRKEFAKSFLEVEEEDEEE